MHKYQPRFHVILDESEKGNSRASLHEMNKDHLRTFIFPETQFMAVTAYQNHMVSKYVAHFQKIRAIQNIKLRELRYGYFNVLRWTFWLNKTKNIFL